MEKGWYKTGEIYGLSDCEREMKGVENIWIQRDEDDEAIYPIHKKFRRSLGAFETGVGQKMYISQIVSYWSAA